MLNGRKIFGAADVKVTEPSQFKVYFFNVSNPEEVQLGIAKPILVEVGPYVYK